MTNNTNVFTTEVPSLTQEHLDGLKNGSGLSLGLLWLLFSDALGEHFTDHGRY